MPDAAVFSKEILRKSLNLELKDLYLDGQCENESSAYFKDRAVCFDENLDNRFESRKLWIGP